MDATTEFLNENALRRFPLAENCVARDQDAGFSWPQGVLLDARGFYRGRSDGMDPVLARYSGKNSGVTGIFAPVGGKNTVFVRWGGSSHPVYAAAALPDPGDAFPATIRMEIPDLAYPGSGVLLGALELTVGAAAAQLDPFAAYNFGESAPFEPGIVFDLYRNVVDRLDAINTAPGTAPRFRVGGAARLRGGYNVDVEPGDPSNPVIALTAAVGYGELGAFAGQLYEPPCAGAIQSFNGVSPDVRGQFFFRAGAGIKITNLPLTHTVRVELDPGQFGALGCVLP